MPVQRRDLLDTEIRGSPSSSCARRTPLGQQPAQRAHSPSPRLKCRARLRELIADLRARSRTVNGCSMRSSAHGRRSARTWFGPCATAAGMNWAWPPRRCGGNHKAARQRVGHCRSVVGCVRGAGRGPFRQPFRRRSAHRRRRCRARRGVDHYRGVPVGAQRSSSPNSRRRGWRRSPAVAPPIGSGAPGADAVINCAGPFAAHRRSGDRVRDPRRDPLS